MSDILYLREFAPLIQLWAGLCALFFYQSLLKKSPLHTYRNSIKELYDGFIMKYSIFIPADKQLQGDEYVEDKWKNLLPTIKNMAILCFFYSAFILVYIGIENCSLYEHYYQVFQVLNIIISVYFILAMLFPKCKIFHSIYTVYIIVVFIIIYFHIHFLINEFFIKHNLYFGSYFSRNAIVVFTIFTCIDGLFLVLLRIIWDFIILAKRKSAIKQIDTNFDFLASVWIGQKKLNDMPEKLKRKLVYRVMNDKIDIRDIKAIDKCIQKEIEEEFYTLTTAWKTRFYKKSKHFLKMIHKTFNKFFGFLIPRK